MGGGGVLCSGGWKFNAKDKQIYYHRLVLAVQSTAYKLLALSFVLGGLHVHSRGVYWEADVTGV